MRVSARSMWKRLMIPSVYAGCDDGFRFSPPILTSQIPYTDMETGYMSIVGRIGTRMSVLSPKKVGMASNDVITRDP